MLVKSYLSSCHSVLYWRQTRAKEYFCTLVSGLTPFVAMFVMWHRADLFTRGVSFALTHNGALIASSAFPLEPLCGCCSKSQHTAHVVIIWMSKYALYTGFIISLFLKLKALGLSRICDFCLLCSVGSAQENQCKQIWLNNRAIGENNVFWRYHVMGAVPLRSCMCSCSLWIIESWLFTTAFIGHSHLLSMVQRFMLPAGYTLYYSKEYI